MTQLYFKHKWRLLVLMISIIGIIIITYNLANNHTEKRPETSQVVQETTTEDVKILDSLEASSENNSEYTSESTSESTSENSSEKTSESATNNSSESSSKNSAESTSETTTEDYVSPFSEYIKQNKDFVGWISIEGTTIDAPIVQSVDNEYYLIHDYTGARNISGAIYMDYKNLGNFYDNHMSLYGHYMTDGTIFHDLHEYKDQAFFEKNNTIVIEGLRESKEFEIFSVHIVSAYSYYLYLNLEDDALLEYAKHFERMSMFDKEVEFPKDLKLLTLVTCTYEFENARILIHAYMK